MILFFLQNNSLLFWEKECWSYLLMHMDFWTHWKKKGTLTNALKKMFYKNRRKDSQEIKRIREKDDLMLNLFRFTEPNS
jgi:hypothetical protein